jgi:hypothetical protein
MSDANPEAERGSSPALGSYFVIPILACGLTIYYLVSTVDLVWEAKATGIFIGAILIALCGVQFVRLGLRIARGQGTVGLGSLVDNNHFNRQRFALVALVAVFIATIHWVGTTLGLFILLVSSMWVMGVRRLRVLVGVAFVAAAVVHFLLIYLLGSQLPAGVFKNIFSFASGGM